MLSALESLPPGLLGNVAGCLNIQDCARLALVSRTLLRFLVENWSPSFLSFDYALRQRIRRQSFNDRRSASLPSHFTHIFNIKSASSSSPEIQEHESLLRNLLVRRGGLKNFQHMRSPKTLKLHHPYFYRQLPLALEKGSKLPAPALCPDDIPLPHDLSLVDLTHVLTANHLSLETIDIAAFDSSPLPWNSTPSRVCPRDVLRRCLYEPTQVDSEPLNPTVVCVWCPDCKPAQHEHSICWQMAGEALRANLMSTLLAAEREATSSPIKRSLQRMEVGASIHVEGECDSQLSREDGCSLISNGCLSFPKLKSLHFRGWAVTNFMSILRVLNCHSFPALEDLSLGGTVIMAPSLTDSKDASPRPRLHVTKHVQGDHGNRVKWSGDNHDLSQKFMQLLSFHFSPFARRYNDKSEEEYWMSLFNGILWNEKSFPQLRSLSLRVGNFDDACRWITPAMENCFSFCPRLESLELDHSIVQTLRMEDPIIKLFSLVRDRAADHVETFPALLFVKLRILNGPFEVVRLQEVLTELFGRLIIVKVRKIFLRLASRLAEDEAALIRNWTSLQRERIQLYIDAHPRVKNRERLRTLTEDELSIFTSTLDGSPMLIITFDSFRPADEPEPAAAHNAEPVSAANPFFYGDQISKLLLKHITPTNPSHQQMLRGVRLGHPPEVRMKQVDSCASARDGPCTEKNTESRREDDDMRLCSTTDAEGYDQPAMSTILKRVTIQLDLPQVWQVTEEEAKAAVTSEVETLRELLSTHPDLARAEEARVTSCTRLTYGGSNWTWWEELICGRIRRPEKTLRVDGWARESKDVIDEEQIKIYKCSHVWSVEGA